MSSPDSRAAFEPRGLPTGIGSLPHEDPREAVGLIFELLPATPFWPQLPRRSPLEGMTLQYLKGFPGLRQPAGGGDPHVETGEEGAAELEPFYAKVLAGDVESFSLDPGRAAGFGAFEEAMARRAGPAPRFVKGHVTGPVTLASSLRDPRGREILYDDTFREALAAFVAQSIRWQVRRLAAHHVPVVLFLDEPVMEVFGSAYSAALTEELVASLWAPCLEAAREEGALSGIHCCGNTDWGLLFRSGTDIVNFDAWHFLDRMLLYPSEVAGFLGGGGILAWGIVPTTREAAGLEAGALLAKLREGMERLAAAGVNADLLRRRCLVTPSCGMGSLEPQLAGRILSLLVEVSEGLGGETA